MGEQQRPGRRPPASTPEQRAAGLAAAKEGRRAALAAGAHLRRDFADAPYWMELARARGLRLPPWHQPPTPRLMKRWLRTLGIPVEDYLAYSGERNLLGFGRANPDWPLRAFVGVLLEAQASGLLSGA